MNIYEAIVWESGRLREKAFAIMSGADYVPGCDAFEAVGAMQVANQALFDAVCAAEVEDSGLTLVRRALTADSRAVSEARADWMGIDDAE